MISLILINEFFILTTSILKSEEESKEFLKILCSENLNAIKDAHEIKNLSNEKMILRHPINK